MPIENSNHKNISRKTIAIALVSILALVGILGVYIYSKNKIATDNQNDLQTKQDISLDDMKPVGSPDTDKFENKNDVPPPVLAPSTNTSNTATAEPTTPKTSDPAQVKLSPKPLPTAPVKLKTTEATPALPAPKNANPTQSTPTANPTQSTPPAEPINLPTTPTNQDRGAFDI